MKNDIYLNIDTIVLRGLSKVDQQRFVEGLQQGLSDQLGGNRTLTARHSASLKTSIALGSVNNSRRLGRSLGESLAHLIVGSDNDDKSEEGGRNA